MFALLQACESESEEADIVNSNPSPPNGTENYLTKGPDYIFDQNKLPVFHIHISTDNLAKIDKNPAAEEYVEASLSFEGESLAKVGLRYKGSIGAFVGCVSGSDWTKPSGYKTCTKLSMKVKINWLDKDDSFYGLKKLQFHSQNLDPSQMRDRLGYWLFRAMGVPAPRCVHSLVYINGEYLGVFSLVEQIDGRFARDHFKDGKGNLYKEVWPIDHNAKAQTANKFIQALETNEDENPTAEMMLSFAGQIEEAKMNEMAELVAKWMNMDEIISYVVVDRTIRVDDGPFHWYCSGNACSNHNYYWYEENAEKKMHLIPWDLDNAFENIPGDRNPVTPIKDKWGEITNNCQPFRHGTFFLQQRSAACDKLIGAWVSFTEVFEQKKMKFIEGPFRKSEVNTLLDQWAAQIRDATEMASRMHADALKPARWEAALLELKANCDIARIQ